MSSIIHFLIQQDALADWIRLRQKTPDECLIYDRDLRGGFAVALREISTHAQRDFHRTKVARQDDDVRCIGMRARPEFRLARDPER